MCNVVLSGVREGAMIISAPVRGVLNVGYHGIKGTVTYIRSNAPTSRRVLFAIGVIALLVAVVTTLVLLKGRIAESNQALAKKIAENKIATIVVGVVAYFGLAGTIRGYETASIASKNLADSIGSSNYLRGELVTARRKLEDAQGKLEALEGDLPGSNDVTKALRERVRDLEEQTTTLQKQLSTKDQDKLEIESELQRKTAQLQDTMALVKTLQDDDSKDDLERVQADTERLRGEIASLKADVTSKDQEKATLQAQLDERQQELLDATTEATKLDETNSRRAQELQSLLDELAATQKKVIELETTNRELLTKEESESNALVERSPRDASSFRGELAAAQARVAALEATHQEFIEAREEYLKERSTRLAEDAEVQRLQEELARANKAVQEARKGLGMAHQKMNELAEATPKYVDEVTKENAQLREVIDRMVKERSDQGAVASQSKPFLMNGSIAAPLRRRSLTSLENKDLALENMAFRKEIAQLHEAVRKQESSVAHEDSQNPLDEPPVTPRSKREAGKEVPLPMTSLPLSPIPTAHSPRASASERPSHAPRVRSKSSDDMSLEPVVEESATSRASENLAATIVVRAVLDAASKEIVTQRSGDSLAVDNAPETSDHGTIPAQQATDTVETVAAEKEDEIKV